MHKIINKSKMRNITFIVTKSQYELPVFPVITLLFINIRSRISEYITYSSPLSAVLQKEMLHTERL